VKEVEPVLGARHPDVCQAALLLQPGGRVEASAVRKQALLHAQHEDHRKLQPLHHVQRDQRHALGAIVHRVHIAHQRDVFEEGLQSLARRQPIVFRCKAAQLEHVAPALLALGAALLDVTLVGTAQEQQVDHLHQPALLGGGAHLVDQVAKIRERAPRGGGQVRHLLQPAQ
jgi:hypothetical protein